MRVGILLLALGCCAYADSQKYLEINRDSLSAYQNVSVLTDSVPAMEDGRNCKSEPISIRTLTNKGKAEASRFRCGAALISDFTFVKYEGKDAVLLGKDESQNFITARFRLEDLKKVYLAQVSSDTTYRVSEKGMDRASAGIFLGALLVIGVISVYLLFVSKVNDIFG